MAKPVSTRKIEKPTAESLAQSAQATQTGGLPPVHRWNPPFCGDIDMRIARDGTWFYQGTPIGRFALARLFSTILRRDGDAYFLVTPVEKVGITVDDVPFVAVDFEVTPAGLRFVTNMGDSALAGPDHPVRVRHDDATGETIPYVLVRDNLEARVDRKSFYRLVDLFETAEHDGARWLGLRSDGAFFPVIAEAALG